MRVKRTAAAGLVGLLTLAACSGGDGGTGTPEKQTTVEESMTGAGMDPNRPAPAAEIEGAQTGGMMKVVSARSPGSMDPTDAYSVESNSILSGLVTRSLTQYVYDPTSKQMVLVPDLATDLGTPNGDFTQWTFTIRKGVMWGENGAEVTPEDVVYGIERSFDRSSFPEGASYSNQYFLDGDSYQGPYKDGTDDRGISVHGQDITLKMARPFPDMPYWGAFPAMGPIPTDKVVNNPADYLQHPWSTGPYMFKAYTPEKSLTLVRNPYWDQDTDPGRHQYVDGWDMKFDVSSAKIDQLMLQDSGAAQNTLSYDNVLPEDYAQFSGDADDRLVTGTLPCTDMLFPDYRKIADIKVRQAIAYAYPYRDAWTASDLIADVTRIPASNIMPPGIAGRRDYNPLPDHEPGTTDVEKARQLLEQADAVGFELVFAYETDDPISRSRKDVMATSLEKAGFKVTAIPTTSAGAYKLRFDPKAPINLRLVSRCSDWPSGATWIPPLFGTTNLAKEGLVSNFGVFSEEQVDNRIERIEAMPLNQQAPAWNTLDKLIQTTYFPVITTAYWGVAMTHGSNVNGDFNDSVLGMPTWKDVWLAAG